jgi:hypothetical protein
MNWLDWLVLSASVCCGIGCFYLHRLIGQNASNNDLPPPQTIAEAIRRKMQEKHKSE